MINSVRGLVLSAILLFFSISLKAQCLSGSYSIGSTGDYVQIKSAVDTLKKYGVCGPVVFTIAAGTYNELISIPLISGVSATNTIRFISTGAVSDVVIQNPSSSSSAAPNYTIQLDGSDYISFENLTIKRSLQSQYATVIDIRNGSDYITFKGNSISNSSVYWAEAILLSSPFSLDHHLTITGNTFTQGYAAIQLNGASNSQKEDGLIITNNTFIRQYSFVFSVQFSSNVNFSGNTLSSNNTSSFFRSCMMGACTGSLKIQNNKIGTNNTYIPGTAFSLNGFSGSAADPAIISNNMVNISGGGSDNPISLSNSDYVNILFNTFKGLNSSGALIYSSSNIRFTNNLVISYSYAIKVSPTSTLIESDYNDLYAYSTTQFASYNGTDCNNLAAWRTKSSKDLHSISIVPKFFPDDLHVKYDVDLNDKGNYNALVPLDIDGEARDLSHPDMGADEFILPDNNLEFLALINPTQKICKGTEPIKVALRNQGQNTVTSFKVYWKRNGVVQPPYNWSGTLLQGAYDTLTIDNSNFGTDDSSYTIRVWLTDPNGQLDTDRTNDSSLVYTTYTKMQGIYTIGGIAPTFKSFTEAATALTNRGICGPVTLNVRDGIYYENFVLNTLIGSSAINTLTIQSESKDSSVVQLKTALRIGECVRLLNCSNIHFRHISYESVNGSDGTLKNVVYMKNCSSISFSNSCFKGLPENVVVAELINSNLSFRNNIFREGTTALLLASNYTTIFNNTFIDQTAGAISVNGRQPFIEHNDIRSAVSTQYYVALSAGADSCSVTANKITFANGAKGINVSSSLALVSNNFVKGGGTAPCYGIYCSGGSQHIYYNTVHLTTTELEYTGALFINAYAAYDVKNNILYNTGGGLALKYNSALSTFSSDYNDLYSTGTKLVNTYANLQAWKLASNRDMNSISAVPAFLSSYDLHSPSYSVVAGKGISVAVMKQDIDRQIRKAIPDIGADEFSNLTYDAGVTWINKPTSGCHGDPYVFIKIKNYGADTLRQAVIQWSVNDQLQTPFEWRGKVAAGETSAPFKIATYLFPYTSSVVKCWTAFDGDINHVNDTLKTSPFKERMGGSYTIGGLNPDFSTLTKAAAAVNNLGLCAPVVFKIRRGYYEESVTLYAIPGSSKVNTVTFTSEDQDSSKVIWYTQLQDETIHNLTLSAAKNVVFSKLCLTKLYFGIYNYYEWNPIAVTLKNNCENISFLNNSIKWSIEGNSSNDSYLLFRNNLITKGHIHLKSISYAQKAKGNTIAYNFFARNVGDMIHLTYQDSLQVMENKTLPDYDLLPRTNFSNDNVLWGAVIGIVSSGPSVAVWNNKINTVIDGSYSVSYFAGIKIDSSFGTASSPILVYNNSISFSDLLDSGAPDTMHGLDSYNSAYVNYFHNSIRLKGGYGNGSAFKLSGAKSAHIKVENNILASTTVKAIEIYTAPESLTSCDYNDLYCNLPGNASNYVPKLIYEYYNPSNPGIGKFYTFSEWQQTRGFDLHSYNTDPNFIADVVGIPQYDNLHIHSAANYLLVNNPIARIYKDIDGDIRSLTNPAIGADEASGYLFNNNAGIEALTSPASTDHCAGMKTISLVLKNHGTDVLTSCTINWSVNGVIQSPYNWTGSLANGSSETVTIGSYHFASGVYELKANSDMPNAAEDQFKYDDSLTTRLHYSMPPVAGFTYSIEDRSVEFTNTSVDATFYQWDFGDYTYATTPDHPTHVYANGTYQITLDVENACGSDSFQETLSILIITDNSEPTNQQTIEIYPNPNTGQLNVKLPVLGTVEWKLLTTTGQMILENSHQTLEEVFKINLSNVPSGLYVLEIKTNEKVSLHKILVHR